MFFRHSKNGYKAILFRINKNNANVKINISKTIYLEKKINLNLLLRLLNFKKV